MMNGIKVFFLLCINDKERQINLSMYLMKRKILCTKALTCTELLGNEGNNINPCCREIELIAKLSKIFQEEAATSQPSSHILDFHNLSFEFPLGLTYPRLPEHASQLRWLASQSLIPHSPSSSLVYCRQPACILNSKCTVRQLDCPQQAFLHEGRCKMAVDWAQDFLIDV